MDHTPSAGQPQARKHRLRRRKPANYDSRIDGYYARKGRRQRAGSAADRDDGGTKSHSQQPSNAEIARAWSSRAGELASWAMRRMVNRTDCWGQYLPLEMRTRNKAFTKKGTLTKDILSQHFYGADQSDLIGLHSTSSDNLSRWLAFDIDHHGEKDADKKRMNRRAAIALYERLKDLGFAPLLISSNGRGGYHLIILFDKPVPTPTVHAFGRWLLRDCRDQQPEQFPKQPRLTKEVPYGNFLRLPGRHHTLNFHSQVWSGESWVKGDEAISAILATKGVSADLIPKEACACEIPEAPATGGPTISADKLPSIQKRALAYLKTKTAKQGQNGDKVTWWAALALVVDFGLSVEQALPIMKEWNATHCHPRWEEKDLLHKLHRADAKPGQRGGLLDGSALAPQQLPAATTGGTRFYLEVPDFVLADWNKMQPTAWPTAKRGRRRRYIGEDLRQGVCHVAVIQQRSSLVVVPDVVFAQLLWGGNEDDWPKRWRRSLLRTLRRSKAGLGGKCVPACPLHHGDVRHKHLHYGVEKTLGFLHRFRTDHDKENDVYTYDFGLKKIDHLEPEEAEERKAIIKYGKKIGGIWSIYLPAWVFGPAILPPGPCRILQAMTRELTRARKRTDRADQAMVMPGSTCCLLNKDNRYVGFNGNGGRRKAHYHNRGYRLKTWMSRADYDVNRDWLEVRKFLLDLEHLREPFGFVVGGYHADKRQWEPLSRLIELSKSEPGQKWLAKCRIKIFAPENYLVIWRQHFASALGLSFIPGGEETLSVAAEDGRRTISSALDLDTWMRQQGLTVRALAKKLDVSPAHVASMRSGSRSWSRAFEERLTAYLQRDGAHKSGQ